MAINPENIDIVTIPQLDTVELALNRLIPHSSQSGQLGKATLSNFASFIAHFVSSVGASGYIETTTNSLPEPSGEGPYFTLTSSGVFNGITANGALNIFSFVDGDWGLTKEINLDFSEPSINGDGFINILPNGSVKTSDEGSIFIQFKNTFSAIPNGITKSITGSGTNGLNWLAYRKSDNSIGLYNYSSVSDLNSGDYLLLAHLYDIDIRKLNSISLNSIRVNGYIKNAKNGDLWPTSTIDVDYIAHTVTLPTIFYQDVNGFKEIKASDYATDENPNPFVFNYDEGVTLQSIVFDPNRFSTPGLNPFYITGIGYPISHSRQILFAQIINNNFSSPYSNDKISAKTLNSIKSFYGKKTTYVNGEGSIDIKLNGDIEVTSGMYSQNKDKEYKGVPNATTSIKGGGGTSGINWIIYNENTNLIYLVNYNGPGIDRDYETVMGSIYDLNPETLQTDLNITVNGVAKGQMLKPTGEILLPKKMFFINTKNLTIYKKSIVRQTSELQNDIVFSQNADNASFQFDAVKRILIDYSLEINPNQTKSNVQFSSIKILFIGVVIIDDP